jgi:hypothetical protein
MERDERTKYDSISQDAEMGQFQREREKKKVSPKTTPQQREEMGDEKKKHPENNTNMERTHVPQPNRRLRYRIDSDLQWFRPIRI